MPTKPGPQRNLMQGLAHGWHPTHMKNPPPVSVAKEFVAADAAKKKRKVKSWLTGTEDA